MLVEGLELYLQHELHGKQMEVCFFFVVFVNNEFKSNECSLRWPDDVLMLLFFLLYVLLFDDQVKICPCLHVHQIVLKMGQVRWGRTVGKNVINSYSFYAIIISSSEKK